MHAHETKDVWAMIDADKRRDRRVKQVSVVAWSVTLLVLLFFAAVVSMQVAQTMRRVELGLASSGAVWEAVLPLVAVVGGLSLVVAVLSTVGVFLRLRTASLHEVQLRLAALEELLTDQPAAEAMPKRQP